MKAKKKIIHVKYKPKIFKKKLDIIKEEAIEVE